MNTAKAKQLRNNLTDAEKKLWRGLRLRQVDGYKFRRQQPIGNYIVDFICLEKRLIVEVDGGQHSSQTDYDSKRDEWLKMPGFQVLRFWNNQVLLETEAVLDVIWRTLNSINP